MPDWFAQNAPSAAGGAGGDWFDQNSPQGATSTYSTAPSGPDYPSTGGMLRNALQEVWGMAKQPIEGLASIPEAVSALTDPATYRGMASTARDVGSALTDPATYHGLYDEAKSSGWAADPYAMGLKTVYEHPVATAMAVEGGVGAVARRGFGMPWTKTEALTPPPPAGAPGQVYADTQSAIVTRGGQAKTAAQGQYEAALQGPLGQVRVPTGKVKTSTLQPPPAQTAAVTAGGQPITQARPPITVKTPETVSFGEAHEAKGIQTPFRETGVKPVTPMERLASQGRQAVDEAMKTAAQKAGADFSEWEDANAAYKNYMDTFRRGPVRRAVGVAPAKFNEFVLHPERWNPPTRGSLYEGGAVPRNLRPDEVIGNFERAAGPQQWELARHHVQADLLNSVTENGAINGEKLKAELTRLDRSNVTDRLLPQASDLRALAEHRISQEQMLNRLRAVAKVVGVGMGGVVGSELYRNYDRLKDLF